MNRTVLLLSIALILASVVGCKSCPPSDSVVLADVSQSIDQSGTTYMFRRIDGLIDNMKRGDSLTVIPITGNAMSDTPGQVVRLIAPTERQAYDNDLTVFREDAHAEVQKMRETALASPGKHTDILGALDVAKQELEASPPRDLKELIVMSDFMEDDGTYSFTADKALTNVIGAQKLAVRLRAEHAFSLRNVHVSLMGLQSKDLRSISPQRQQATCAFWKIYLGVPIQL